MYVKFRLTTNNQGYVLLHGIIHISFSSDFTDKLWVGLGLGVN